MNKRRRTATDVVAGLCGALYGAVVGACVPLAALGFVASIVQTEAFGITAFSFMTVFEVLGAIAGAAVGGTLATLAALSLFGPRPVPVGSTPDERGTVTQRTEKLVPWTVLAGVLTFLALNQLIVTTLNEVWLVIRLPFLSIDPGRPLPLSVRVPLTLATAVVAAATSRLMFRFFARRVT